MAGQADRTGREVAVASRRNGSETLVTQLGELGLSPNESRVYLALLRVSVATASQLADIAEVPRAKVYGALSALEARGLCAALGGAVARFRAIDPDSAIAALIAHREHERELAGERERELALALRRSLPKLEEPTPPSEGLVHIESVSGRARTSEILEQMIGSARHSLLMIQQPPFIQPPSRWNQAELEALQRGVSVRVIYSADSLDERRRYQPLANAGADIKVLDRPAMKLSVSDRSEALLALRDPVTGEQGETSALIRHPDLVEAIALLFDKEWRKARKLR